MSANILTVNQAFDVFINRLELNPTRVALASQRYNAIKTAIENALSRAVVKQVGSFARRTKIKPVNDNVNLDVDAIVCLGDTYKYASNQGVVPKGAIEIVWNALTENNTYKKMLPKRSVPVIELIYHDGFKIELIPCFRDFTNTYPRQDGPACYTVGHESGQWVPADYDYDAKVITGYNQSEVVKGLLVPSIKMMKAYFRNNNIPIKSFHTEVMCVLVTPRVVSRLSGSYFTPNLSHILAEGLGYMADIFDRPVSIPFSYSTAIESHLSYSDKQYLKENLRMLSAIATRICELGNSDRALQSWKNFMGEPFPNL